MMRKLGMVLALTSDDRHLLLRAWFYLLVADLRLRWHSYQQVQAALALKQPLTAPDEAQP